VVSELNFGWIARIPGVHCQSRRDFERNLSRGPRVKGPEETMRVCSNPKCVHADEAQPIERFYRDELANRRGRRCADCRIAYGRNYEATKRAAKALARGRG
jgi:hypothetical protein